MNRLENWFCSTHFWSRVTRKRLLPWMLQGGDLGDSVLELGAGPGAATAALQQNFPSVTSLEYNEVFARSALQASRSGVISANHTTPHAARVVQGDAASLP